MEDSMSAADVPVGTSQSSSSMPSIDELLHQYEVCSVWKLISMPNLTAFCHEHKCDKCSTYLEHSLIAAHAGELCAHPDGLELQLDHAWPAVMNDIYRDVSLTASLSPKNLMLPMTCATPGMTRLTAAGGQSMTCATSSMGSIVFGAGLRKSLPSTRASRKKNQR